MAGVTGRSIFHFRCDAGYTGQHCEKKDYSVLYVVPGPVRFQYVLIAAVIGTIQIAIICVVVLCITRSVSLILCNRKKKRTFFPALCTDYTDFCSDTCDNKYHLIHQQTGDIAWSHQPVLLYCYNSIFTCFLIKLRWRWCLQQMKVPILYSDAWTNIVHINKGDINTAAGSTLNKTNRISIWFP